MGWMGCDEVGLEGVRLYPLCFSAGDDLDLVLGVFREMEQE